MDVKVKQLSESNDEMFADIIQGLSQSPKTLPCKYFYDETGSILFEQICDLPEYYITRAEIQLLQEIQSELVELIGSNAIIIEPGAGAGVKIQELLGALKSPETYVPIDISADFLMYSADKIEQKFPQVNINPIQADFTKKIEWHGDQQLKNRLVFFPGSTIGNFTPAQAQEFLKNQATLVGSSGAILVGVDLVKPAARLEAAYNDKLGVTAQFNLNLLTRINSELDANFNLNQFKHIAFFNTRESRIEMHLQSTAKQTVKIQHQEFQFEAAENIHTENSYKYSIESFIAMASEAGLQSQHCWVDDEQLISIHYLVPRS